MYILIYTRITNDCMQEDSMKKLQGDYVSWLVLLTGAAQLLLVCGGGLPAGMLIFMTSAM